MPDNTYQRAYMPNPTAERRNPTEMGISKPIFYMRPPEERKKRMRFNPEELGFVTFKCDKPNETRYNLHTEECNYRIAYYHDLHKWLGVKVMRDKDGELFTQDMFNYLTIDSHKFGKDLFERLGII